MSSTRGLSLLTNTLALGCVASLTTGCVFPDNRSWSAKRLDEVTHTFDANRPAPGSPLTAAQLTALDQLWHGKLRMQAFLGSVFSTEASTDERNHVCALNMAAEQLLETGYADTPNRQTAFAFEAALRFQDSAYERCATGDPARWKAFQAALLGRISERVSLPKSEWIAYAQEDRYLVLDGRLASDASGRTALTGMRKVGTTTTVDGYELSQDARGKTTLEPQLTNRDVITRNDREIAILESPTSTDGIDPMQVMSINHCLVKPQGEDSFLIKGGTRIRALRTQMIACGYEDIWVWTSWKKQDAGTPQ
jgi:hypothetical protein